MVSALLKYVLQYHDEHLKNSKDITTFEKKMKTCLFKGHRCPWITH